MSQVEFYDEVAGLASFVIEGEEYSEDGEMCSCSRCCI